MRKSVTFWDGIKAEISKMSPDPSELHVVGSSGKKRGKLRKTTPTKGMS